MAQHRAEPTRMRLILVAAVTALAFTGAHAEPVPGVCHVSSDQPSCEATLVTGGQLVLAMPVGSVRVTVLRDGDRIFRRCYGGHLVYSSIAPDALEAGDVIKMASLSSTTVAAVYGGPVPSRFTAGVGGETGCL